MSNNKDKWIDVVAKLTKLTQEKKLLWVTTDSPSSTPSYVTIRISFATKYKGRSLRLYEKEFDHTSNRSIIGGLMFEETETVLELLDENGIGIWSFPGTRALSDLMSAVRFQISGANDFINDVLADDD